MYLDSDCRGNLICFQRDGSQMVPGCKGSGSRGKDYCTDPSLRPDPTNRPTLAPQSTSGRFMLRLYWQRSYFWQETHRETWWCLECTKCREFSLGDGPRHGCVVPGNNGDSCRAGHTIWIRKCKDTRRHFKWNIRKNSGSGDQIQASGSNLCLSTRNNRYIELRPCDSGNSRQLFKTISNINKFELRPYHQRNWSTKDAKCLSQLHHPKVRTTSIFCVACIGAISNLLFIEKDKELVGLHQCQTAKNHETLYWESYQR